MQKLTAALLLTSSLLLATSASAANALACKDIVGYWSAPKLGKWTDVVLHIEDTGGNPMEDASIRYVPEADQTANFGMLKGQCVQNKDGTVTMDITRDSYSIQFNMQTQLVNKSTLAVKSFSYSIPYDGNGSGISGTLTK